MESGLATGEGGLRGREAGRGAGARAGTGGDGEGYCEDGCDVRL